MTTIGRAFLLAAVFASCAGYLQVRRQGATPPPRETLEILPMRIADWRGQAADPLDARVLAVLGADDYTSRFYSDPAGRQLGLYVGYHASQAQGDSIHSPLNCMPGAGWLAVERTTVQVPRTAPSGSVQPHPPATVNHVLVQKGESRQVVLYWYQSQGRIIASEYAAKAFLFVDAVRSGRTDAALVRIVAPVAREDARGAEASLIASKFAEALLPILARHIPS